MTRSNFENSYYMLWSVEPEKDKNGDYHVDGDYSACEDKWWPEVWPFNFVLIPGEMMEVTEAFWERLFGWRQRCRTSPKTKE